MNLDRLSWIGDVEPTAVSFPAIGDDLDEHSAGLGVGNVSDSFTVGLDAQFQFLVLQQFALFDIFHVDAGIFDRNIIIAASDLDGDSAERVGPRWLRLWRRRGRILRAGVRSKSAQQKQGQDEWQTHQWKSQSVHVVLDYILHGRPGRVKPLRFQLGCGTGWICSSTGGRFEKIRRGRIDGQVLLLYLFRNLPGRKQQVTTAGERP